MHGTAGSRGFYQLTGREQRRRRGPRRHRSAFTVAARRSFAGIELQTTVSKSEGMGRYRRMRGFHFGDSGHGSGLEDGRLRAAIVAVPGARGEALVAGRVRGAGWER